MREVEEILSRDPGGRGLMGFVRSGDLFALARELSRIERAMIITGFPMHAADSHICCETDGPLGAADMAYALTGFGAKVSVVTDETSFMQVRAAVDCRAPNARTYLLKRGEPEAARRLVNDINPTHIIPIERPGKARDGHYHTARGAVIDDMLADTDMLYAYARERGAFSIAIGDGGNELGTGAYREAVARLIPGGGAIAAGLTADITLITGVSNWWGWGVAAILSALSGRDLLPTAGNETRLIKTVVEAGAVDGITKLPTLSVDNLSLETNLEVLSALRRALSDYLIRRPHD